MTNATSRYDKENYAVWENFRKLQLWRGVVQEQRYEKFYWCTGSRSSKPKITACNYHPIPSLWCSVAEKAPGFLFSFWKRFVVISPGGPLIRAMAHAPAILERIHIPPCLSGQEAVSSSTSTACYSVSQLTWLPFLSLFVFLCSFSSLWSAVMHVTLCSQMSYKQKQC